MKHTAYQLFKKPFFGRFMRPWRWPESVDRSPWHALRVTSESGSQLSALVAESTAPQVKGAVVMAHPMGVIAKGFWMKNGHADALRNAGYHVMVFDLNGFGESPSTNMEYPLDILAAGQAMQTRYPNLPIAVVGASMGAAMSMCALSKPNHPFKAAVLEGAFPTLLHFWGRYPIPKLGIQLSKIVYPAGERRMRPVLAADQLVGTPGIFLIYGEADIYTPVNDGKLLWQALKDKTETDFWAVPNADHTHAFRAQPEEYTRKVVAFLDEQMGVTPAAVRSV